MSRIPSASKKVIDVARSTCRFIMVNGYSRLSISNDENLMKVFLYIFSLIFLLLALLTESTRFALCQLSSLSLFVLYHL